MNRNNKEKIKILLLDATNFIDFPLGGQLSMWRNLIRNIPSEIELLLVGVSNNLEDEGKWRNVIIQGRKVKFLSVGDYKRFRKKIPYRLQFLIRLYKHRMHIFRRKFDYVIVRTVEYIPPISRLSQFYNRKIFLYMAGANMPIAASRFKIFRLKPFVKLFYNLIFVPSLKKCNKVFGINKECKELCEKILGKSNRCVFLPLGVDTELFKPISENLISKDETIKICYSGRLHQVKGFDLMLPAFKTFLERTDKTATFYIIGDGEFRREIENMINKFGLNHNVILMGKVPHNRLPYLLNKCHVFLLCSYKEGLPNSILEAMACGIPVVATAVGGIPILVKNGFTGYLLTKRDPTLVADKISLVIDNREILSKNCRNLIIKEYDIKKIIEKLIHEIINDNIIKS